MSERFTIEISSEDAQKFRRIAELAGQPIESILSDALIYLVPPTEGLDIQIERVASYSNAQLWAIVETPVLSKAELEEREPILQRNKQGIHSEEDEKYLDTFSELYNKRVLLRSEALVTLQERGYDVKAYLKQNAPK